MRRLPSTVRQVLVDLEMLSHGSTQAWNPTGRSTGEHVLPHGELRPPHVTFRLLYLEADTAEARALVVKAAQDELKHHRGHEVDRSHVVAETREEEDERILKDGEGFTPAEVALRFKCTVTRVRSVRRDHERTIEYGRPLDEPTKDRLSRSERRARAVAYKEQGMTLTQISQLLGCDKATVSRDLRAA